VSILFFFKLGLLGLWALWYLIAFSANLCESFEALGIFRNTWPLASGNFQAVTRAVKSYSNYRWIPRLLFAGVLCWQLLSVSLFAWAIVSSVLAETINFDAVNGAFVAALSLWAAFMLADEMLKQYDTEHPHVLFFMAQLVTFVALHVLPS
jgi:hypothetical protein